MLIFILNSFLGLSRAFGDFEFKENSSKGPEEQMVIVSPDVISVKVTSETDFLVLASDGIWESMTPQEVIDLLMKKFITKI